MGPPAGAWSLKPQCPCGPGMKLQLPVLYPRTAPSLWLVPQPRLLLAWVALFVTNRSWPAFNPFPSSPTAGTQRSFPWRDPHPVASWVFSLGNSVQISHPLYRSASREAAFVYCRSETRVWGGEAGSLAPVLAFAGLCELYQQALWLTFIKLSARNRRDREDAGARFVSAIIIPRGSCHCHLRLVLGAPSNPSSSNPNGKYSRWGLFAEVAP